MADTNMRSETLPQAGWRDGVPGYWFGTFFLPRMAGGETPPNPGEGDPPPSDDTKGKDGKDFDPVRAQSTIENLRTSENDLKKQLKDRDKKLTDIEKRLQDFEDKDKSELEKATGKVTATEQKLSETETRLRSMSIRVAVAESASAAGIAPDSVKAALRLLDANAIEMDENGEPKGIESALKALVKEFPMLASPEQGTTTRTASRSVPATPKPSGQAPTRDEQVKEVTNQMRANPRYSF